jgi:hypothetical protein
MKMQDLAGRRIKISAHTITVLDDNDKTAGMVTRVKDFLRMPARDQFDPRIVPANRLANDEWDRMFYVDGKWHYIADAYAMERAKCLEASEGPARRERLERIEAAAIAFGAEVIRVERATDTREPFDGSAGNRRWRRNKWGTY